MVIWRVDKALLKQPFGTDVDALLAHSPFGWTVTHGLRTMAEQAALYAIYQQDRARHPRAAPPGKSAHNFGLAVDVVLDGDPDKAGLQPDYNESHEGWRWLFDAVDAHPRLHSGRSFRDGDHIEAVHWGALK